jgi:hypothetical protein
MTGGVIEVAPSALKAPSNSAYQQLTQEFPNHHFTAVVMTNYHPA